MYWWASRECRYSGARRGIGGIKGHWGLQGGVWESGPLGGIRGCQGVLGLAGSVGTQGPEVV